ncbi:MAG: hypothetical protein VXW27_10210, partial [Pseudomonadota bacterium]|nr:hypothetical protein [Pseudomonadota bacterium]
VDCRALAVAMHMIALPGVVPQARIPSRTRRRPSRVHILRHSATRAHSAPPRSTRRSARAAHAARGLSARARPRPRGAAARAAPSRAPGRRPARARAVGALCVASGGGSSAREL